MRHAEQLREQAKVLRSMAAGFDILSIRDRLLSLAAMTEQLATAVERVSRERRLAPIDPASKKPAPNHH
jgi:hypothetical protein